MNNSSARRLVLGLVSSVLLSISLASAASAKVPVHVRAVTWQGKVLVDREIRTATTTVPTSARASCFGGSPTNGARRIPGATALGALQDAQAASRPRQPLLITNAFDFGLGLCGVGSQTATGEQFWELTYNHKPSMLGGEAQEVDSGSTVLWYLSQSYNSPSPDEMELRAPGVVRRNAPFAVRVVAYNDKGRARPVRGAQLSLPGARPTNGRGYTRIRISRRSRFAARAPGLIVSNRVVVGVRR
jgi:hypothetical protein